MKELSFHENLLSYLEVWSWKLAYISGLLVVLLGCRYFRLKNTLEFIEIDCGIMGTEENYIAFRVDWYLDNTLCLQKIGKYQ